MSRPDGGEARELRILNAIAEGLNSASDTAQALERTLALLAELLGLETAWVWLLDRETGQYYSAGARNLPPYLREPVRMTGATCWCLGEFKNGRLTPSNIHLMQCSRLYAAVEANDAAATAGLCCHASLPLYFQDEPLGVMNIAGPAWRELTEDELRLLSTVAYQVGIAVERARLAEDGARLARSEERARLAREIHDTLAQGLTGIALQLESALTHLESDPRRARKRVERALELARENLEEARRSVLDLRAAPLGGKPLAAAVRSLARSFTADTGVRVRVMIGPLPSLAPDLEGELYRILQEALANVRKHAGATNVRVELRERDGTLRLRMEDDGCGFDPDERTGTGYGLRGMRERAALVGGTFEVVGAPGRGAALSVEVPLPKDPPL